MSSNVQRADFVNKTIIPDKSGGHMADLSNGYTKVANEIQQLKPRLRMSGREWQCFEAVIWLTYGWNKKQDRVTNTVIAELTGLSDTHVSDAIKALAERKIIFSHKQGMMKLVGVNTELSAWILDKLKAGRKFPKTGKVLPETGKRFPKTVATQYKNKNSIKRITSDNSKESPDSRLAKFLSTHPDAFVYSANGAKWGTEGDDKACRWMFLQISIVDPTAKEPSWADWSNVIRLMREQDNRTHKEICEVFRWANRDSFWCVNILSPAKLREKWGTLSAQKTQPNRKQRVDAEPVTHWNDKEAWEKEFI